MDKNNVIELERRVIDTDPLTELLKEGATGNCSLKQRKAKYRICWHSIRIVALHVAMPAWCAMDTCQNVSCRPVWDPSG